ncbi:MAG: hypothetical protein JXB17_02420 [Bacteroidales bacterium]|nr:hypothetical protein [Bacteroidales bacterium]
MQTIRLRVNDNIFDKLIWFLNKFNKHELEIIHEDNKFIKDQEYLHKELLEIETGKAKFISINELNDSLDKIIDKYET